jgi:hypothetical protein
MPFVRCLNLACHKEISDEAASCPFCGHPGPAVTVYVKHEKKSNIKTFLINLVCAMTFIGILFICLPPRAASHIKNYLLQSR